MNKPLPKRKSIRLKHYDYSWPGFYFITICTQNRKHLFGEIVDGEMQLNSAGEMINTVWNEIPRFYDHIQIDAFIIMPNHIHGIIQIAPYGPIPYRPANSEYPPANSEYPPANSEYPPANSEYRAEMDSAPTLGMIVQSFKRYTTIEYIKMVKQNIVPPFDRRIWQRNYWEHIVRDENELNRIQEYIVRNPEKWEMDKLNENADHMLTETLIIFEEQ